MTKPKANLLCAKWVYPDIDWVALPDGKIVANPFRGVEATFDLSNRHDAAKVIMKLKLEHNITIKKRKHHWEAITQGDSKGIEPNADIEILLARLVERVMK